MPQTINLLQQIELYFFSCVIFSENKSIKIMG
jgi:hypothetical protein